MSSTGNSPRQKDPLSQVPEEPKALPAAAAIPSLSLAPMAPASCERAALALDAQSLLSQRKLPQAIALLRAQIAESATPESRLQLAKCLAEQGLFLEALETIKTLQRRRGLEHKAGLRLEAGIWKDFIGLYIGGNPGPLIKRCRQILRSVASERLASTRAIAQDFLARGLVVAVHWNLLPRSALLEASASLEASEQIFREKSDIESALQCVLRRGQTLLMIDPKAFDQACALFSRAREEARGAGLTYREGQALLRLAETRARMGDASIVELTATSLPENSAQLYAQAIACFEAIGSPIGEGEAFLAQAQSIQRYDAALPESATCSTAQPNAVLALHPQEPARSAKEEASPGKRYLIAKDLALRAATGLKLSGNFSGQFEALSIVAMIALETGDLAGSLEYRFEAMASANRMGFRVGSASTQLGIADIYLRRGDMQNALVEFRKASSQITVPALQGLGNLSLANAYQLMGLPEQAESTCRAAIEALRGNNDEVLSQAYLVLGNVLSERRAFSEALKILEKGRRFDLKHGYLEASAEKLQLWAQALVLEDKQTSKSQTTSPCVRERAIKQLEKEIKRVAAMTTASARQVEAGLWQSLGQVYISCDDVVAALKHLGQARMRYEAAGLLSQRANTDAIIGLAYKLLAQQGHPEALREATWHLNQAKQFFKVAGMQEQELRMQALADDDGSASGEQETLRESRERLSTAQVHGRKRVIH